MRRYRANGSHVTACTAASDATFLPRVARTCIAQLCYCMSSVRLSVRSSVCQSVTLVDCDHIHQDSQKVISPIGYSFPYLGILSTFENTKTNFVIFGAELGWSR